MWKLIEKNHPGIIIFFTESHILCMYIYICIVDNELIELQC